MRARRPEAWLGVAVLIVTVGFVVINLRPGLWFTDTTPTGGDLGAHVWAPAYLRDVLLGELRLTGWTHDWYAGFPAFTFYMVVPSLLVVIVNAGIGLPVGLFAHVAAAGAAVGIVRLPALRRSWDVAPIRQRILVVAVSVAAAAAVLQLLGLLDGRVLELGPLGNVRYEQALVDRALAALLLPAVAAGWTWISLRTRPVIQPAAALAAALMALLVVPMPYGVSLKLVVIAGVVALPAATWGMARTAGVAPPGQALAAAAALLFLFDRSFNIYGGNLMSTMAGEFAYSLGLACAVAYIGVAAQGMDSGRRRVLAGALLALTGLLHLFSALFALGATAALLLVGEGRWSAWRRRLGWTAATGALAAALSAWWVLPFWWNRGLLNDMGWGKERRYVSALWSRREFDYSFLVNDPPLQPFVLFVAVSAAAYAAVRAWRALSLGDSRSTSEPLPTQRGVRLWMALVLTAVIFAVTFRVMPEGRLWNVRILPFYYLTVYLSAALGAGEFLRWARQSLDRRRAARLEAGGVARRGLSAGSTVVVGAVVVIVAAVLVAVGLPLRSLPGGRAGSDGSYRWGPLSTGHTNLGTYWVQYNFEGYEGRTPTDAGGGSSEYWDFVDLMAEVGETSGCGPSLWEYEAGRLGSYGTPMAPMLLPYWTDRCIGSMEGLYFEASATTPYHFLMQSELSAAPSRAQRDLPYSGLDVSAGAEHLRLMGVRYYMAFSERTVREARAEPDLSEIAASGPWVVFEVTGSRPISGLSTLPVVVDGLDASSGRWLEASAGAFLAGEDRPVLAAAGPDGWPRMMLPDPHAASGGSAGVAEGDLDRADRMRRLAQALPLAAPRVEIEPAAVSDIVRRDHSISFRVDRVGVPVLVRTSYFPNWSVSGAEGPFRATPNFMVVVPTDTEVRLTYGRSGVEWLAFVITLGGLLAAAWLTWRAPRATGVGVAAASADNTGKTATGEGLRTDTAEADGADCEPTEADGRGAAEESTRPVQP